VSLFRVLGRLVGGLLGTGGVALLGAVLALGLVVMGVLL
jgi:hypothetical protein